MSLDTKEFVIESGADAGKRFLITTPDAFRGEQLYIKIMSVCSNATSNDQVVKRLMGTDEGREVWYSLLDFVKIIEGTIPRKIDKEDIKSPQTLIKIRTEVLTTLLAFISE